jgi:hypothetical protein
VLDCLSSVIVSIYLSISAPQKQKPAAGPTREWTPDEDSDYDEDDDLEVPSWCASAAGTKLSTMQARGSMGECVCMYVFMYVCMYVCMLCFVCYVTYAM